MKIKLTSRVLAMFLAILMCVSLLPANVMADTVDVYGYEAEASGAPVQDVPINNLLNSGAGSLEDLGQNYTIQGNEEVTAGSITLSGEYKTSYVIGDVFNPNGMIITVTCDNGSTIELSADDAIFSGFDGTLPGSQAITVKYGEFETTYTVTVKDYWDGSGTEVDPYLLNDQADLDRLSDLVSGGKNFSGKYFALTQNIELDGDWTPIGVGAAGKRFAGTFDGGGYTISFAFGSYPLFGAVDGNSTIKNLNIFGEYIADFGLIKGFVSATMSSNANIDNVTIKSGTTIKKSGFAGDPASVVALYNITNCTVESGVRIGYDAVANAPADSSEGYSAGGFSGGPGVGSFISGLCGTVTNSVSYATVYGQNNVGGIVGYKAQSMRPFTIKNCVFGGKIIATGTHVGGIVGNGYVHSTAGNAPGAIIENCYATGTVTGADKVGGIFGGEGGQLQAWDNGIGYVRNNHFVGMVEATDGDNVGGIIGYMASLNKYNIISNNYYLNTCGAVRGIGGARYVDTSCATATEDNVERTFNTSVALPGIVSGSGMMASGVTKKNHNRTDDPMGADMDALAKAVTAVQMKDGTIKNLLNSGAGSLENWGQGHNYPIHGADEAELITVYFTLLGDTEHDNTEIHTLKGGGLITWLEKDAYTVSVNATVLDAFEKVLTETGLTWENSGGNYIESVTKGGVKLAAFTNGSLSGWMYTLNGVYPLFGVAEQHLEDGDEIVFHYTDDYTKEDFDWVTVDKAALAAVIAEAEALTESNYTAESWAVLQTALTEAQDVAAAENATQEQIDTAKATLSNAINALVAQAGPFAPVTYSAQLSASLAYIVSSVPAPGFGTGGGEWTVLTLARAGYTVPGGYYDGYIAKVIKALKDAEDNGFTPGQLDTRKSTENERLVLALASLGIDPTDIGGYNLLQPLANYDWTVWQGLNSTTFALLAFDANNFEIPDVTGLTPPVSANTSVQTTRQKLIDKLLDWEIASAGGWSQSSATTPDADGTAQAIQALAPYYGKAGHENVTAAVDRALTVLSDMQNADGGFASWGTVNAESCAQVVVALTALGIDPQTDSRFVKSNGNPVSALLSFYVEGGGFKHVASGTVNGMATDQGSYALVAYDRFKNDKNELYDMKDAFEAVEEPSDKTALNALIAQAEALSQSKYTTDTWKALQTALTAAKTVAINDDAIQAEVETAKSALKTAIDSLQLAGGGTTPTTPKINVTFRLIGANKTDGDIDLSGGDYKGANYVTWIATKSYSMNEGDTVYDVFVKAISDAGMTAVGADGNYVKSITAPSELGRYVLGEFTNGRYSGWMYTINGKHPGYGLKEQVIKNGDKIVWHYVNDYRYEVEDWFDDAEYPVFGDGTYWNKWLNAADENPSSGSTSTNTNTTVTPTETVSVTEKDVADAIKAAETQKTDIVIKPNLGNKTTSSISADISKKSFEDISKTGLGLKVETPEGSVTFDQTAQNAIVGTATGGTITIVIEAVDKEALTKEQSALIGDKPVIDLTVMSGGKVISNFNSGKVKVSIPYELKAGEKAEGLVVWYLADNGSMTQLPCTYNAATKCVEFTVDHFSRYAVAYDAEQAVWNNPFTDVAENDWFYGYVKYAFENGLMKGMSDTEFAPNSNVTRAMLMTILYNYEGEPGTTGENPFTDVENGQWYTKAIIWASANGIVDGYGGGLFGTNDKITREQVAVILMRYAKLKGLDVSKANELTAYTDVSEISDWAVNAMTWANAEGLMNGRSNTELAPKGNTTRAEIATILMKFAKGFVK